MNATKKLLLILVIVAGTIAFDQVTKVAVRKNMRLGEQISVVNKYLVMIHIENEGAFLGMGDSLSKPLRIVLLSVIPLIAIMMGLWYIARTPMTIWRIVAFSLIIGGGIGNIYDRIFYGKVTDFLYMDFVLFHTGIFNIADLFVMIGMGILLYFMLFRKKTEVKQTT